MWWRLGLATFIGIVIGAAATYGIFYLYFDAQKDTRSSYLPQRWSSAEKEWPAFADWLRGGGRAFVEDTAYWAATDGMTEEQVRVIFGPPDLVAIGDNELKAHPGVNLNGTAGAYFYKVGRFAREWNLFANRVFAILFDAQGKIIFRLGFGESDGGQLAEIDTDSRSERRIAPPAIPRAAHAADDGRSQMPAKGQKLTTN